MPAPVTNGDARHCFPWHLRRRSEGWEQRPVASPGPGTGNRSCSHRTCTGPGSCVLGPGTATVPPSSFRGLCESLEGEAGMEGVFKHVLHLQVSLPPYPSGSLLVGLGPRQTYMGSSPFKALLSDAVLLEF